MDKSKIEVFDTITIGDVYAKCVSSDTVDFLEKYWMAYRDENEAMGEHIVNVHAAIEMMDSEDVDSDGMKNHPNIELVMQEIAELIQVADKQEIAYIRFIH